MSLLRWLAIAAAALSAEVLAAGPVEVTEYVKNLMAAGEAPRISLTHVTGSLTVKGTDLPNLHVRAIKRARGADAEAASRRLKQIHVEITGGVGAASIQTRHGEVTDWEALKSLWKEGRLGDVDVDYEIALPRKSQLEISTVAGQARIDLVEGGLSLNAFESRIELTRIAGGCRIVTVGGSLDLAAVAGGLAVQMVSASLKGRMVHGSCVVDTVGGPVELSLDPRRPAVARVTSVNGPVSIWLPEHLPVTYRLDSSGGAIQSDFPASSAREPTRVHGQVGSGGNDIAVRSVSGAISLRRAPSNKSVTGN